ncbi:hypothetical protein EMMF5_005137 [Cystobasidiomycetes sp. EMM_F5]
MLSDVLSQLSQALPSAVLSIPGPAAVGSALGINDSSIANKTPSALIVPSYSNFTSQGWNVRFNAFVYKLPTIDESQVTKAAQLLGLSNSTLNSTERALLTNRTTDLASIPIPNANNVTVQVVYNGRNVSTPVKLQQADNFGEIDQFQVVPGLGNMTGNSTQLQNTTIVQLYAQGYSGPGNGSSILVPETGISVISDIDDVLRVTQVYIPQNGLKNSFVEPYVNYANTPEVFAHWAKTLPRPAFHYDTTTPLELTRTYVEYLFNNYPFGSLEMRPINLTQPSSILDARSQSLQRLFETFPRRKFVLVGDTSSSSLLTAYPQIAQMFPSQLACIFIRNTSATDPSDKLPYDTKEFRNVNSSQYFFYVQPSDLLNLDIANGQCVNSSIPQNVTFGYQGLP